MDEFPEKYHFLNNLFEEIFFKKIKFILHLDIKLIYV